MIVLPEGDRTDVVQEERLCLPYWTMILAICVVVDESKCLDISIWEFSIKLKHLPFWAAVTCDADGPCSAQEPESSFTMLLTERSPAFVFWNDRSNSTFLRWHMSISEEKWTVLFFFCASRMTPFLLFTFVNCHGGIFSSFSHSLSTAALASGIFHCSRHGNKFVHQIVVTSRIEPFLLDVIFMILKQSSFQTLSRRFVTVHDACILRSASVRFAASFRALMVLDLTKHDCFHWQFQLFRAFFHGFFQLNIFWIDKIDASQFPELSSFGFSIAHCCFSLRWAAFHIPNQISGDKWSGLHVAWILVSRSPGPCAPIWRFFVQYSELREASPRFRQFPVAINVPIIVCTAVQQHIRGSTCSPDHDWEWFFRGHSLTLGSTWWRSM